MPDLLLANASWPDLRSGDIVVDRDVDAIRNPFQPVGQQVGQPLEENVKAAR